MFNSKLNRVAAAALAVAALGGVSSPANAAQCTSGQQFANAQP